MDSGRSEAEAGADARPLQADMHPQAIKGLAYPRILAERLLTPDAATTIRSGELIDRQWEAIYNRERGIMASWHHAALRRAPAARAAL